VLEGEHAALPTCFSTAAFAGVSFRHF